VETRRTTITEVVTNVTAFHADHLAYIVVNGTIRKANTTDKRFGAGISGRKVSVESLITDERAGWCNGHTAFALGFKERIELFEGMARHITHLVLKELHHATSGDTLLNERQHTIHVKAVHWATTIGHHTIVNGNDAGAGHLIGKVNHGLLEIDKPKNFRFIAGLDGLNEFVPIWVIRTSGINLVLRVDHRQTSIRN